jgi:hypothetical protein
MRSASATANAASVSDGTNQKMKRFFVGLFVFIVAIFIVAFMAWTFWFVLTASRTNQASQTKDFLELAGLLLAVLTSAVSAGASYIIRRTQENQEKALEELKITLSQITSRRFEAYYAAWSGVGKYFRVLKKLESGIYDTAGISSAIEKCESAEALSLLLDEKDRELFTEYWQASNYIKESAENLGGDQAKIRDLWSRSYLKLGKQYSNILQNYRETLTSKK